jgi:hypothetical protein
LFVQKNKKDALNFDTEFTKEDPVLTPVNPEILKTINQVDTVPDSLLPRSRTTDA